MPKKLRTSITSMVAFVVLGVARPAPGSSLVHVPTLLEATRDAEEVGTSTNIFERVSARYRDLNFGGEARQERTSVERNESFDAVEREDDKGESGGGLDDASRSTKEYLEGKGVNDSGADPAESMEQGDGGTHVEGPEPIDQAAHGGAGGQGETGGGGEGGNEGGSEGGDEQGGGSGD